MGANSFLYEMTPIIMGGNNENDRVASPESVPIHLNMATFNKQTLSKEATIYIPKKHFQYKLTYIKQAPAFNIQ